MEKLKEFSEELHALYLNAKALRVNNGNMDDYNFHFACGLETAYQRAKIRLNEIIDLETRPTLF